MKRARPRHSNYPGNEWLESAFAKLGVEASVPFAHGVLRGTLVNPAKADPGRAFFQILRTKTPLDRRPAEVDAVIEGLFCLGDGIIKSYLFDRDLPEAISQDQTGCPDFRTLCGRIVDLTDGFYIGLASAPIPLECRIEECDAWVEGIVRDAKACAKWFKKPARFEAVHPTPEQRRSSLEGCLARIESDMLLLGRHVAKTAERSAVRSPKLAASQEDDCPICSSMGGHGFKGRFRGRGNAVRH